MSTRTLVLMGLFLFFVAGFSDVCAASAHGTIAPRVANHHNWIRVARCESGVAKRRHSSTGKYHGGLQWSLSTWRAVNRSQYGDPHNAPWWIEFVNANRLKARYGLGQWPHCGRYW